MVNLLKKSIFVLGLGFCLLLLFIGGNRIWTQASMASTVGPNGKLPTYTEIFTTMIFGRLNKPDGSYYDMDDIIEQAESSNNIFPLKGNIGMGTKNPSQKLEVIGNISADNLWIKDEAKWANDIGGSIKMEYYDCTWMGNCRSDKGWGTCTCNGIPNCRRVSGDRMEINLRPPWVIVGGNYNSTNYTDAIYACKMRLTLE